MCSDHRQDNTGTPGIHELQVRIRELEETVRELRSGSERGIRTLLNPSDIPIGYQSLDIQGTIIEINDAWLSELGYDRDEVIGKWFGDFLTPETAAVFGEEFPGIYAEDDYHSTHCDMVRKDGTTITVLFDGRCIRDKAGKFLFTHCVWKDVTKEHEAEERLKASEEKYRLFLQNFQGIAYQAETGAFRLILFEGQVEEITGYTSEDFMDGTIRWDQLIHPDDQEIVFSEARNLLSNPEYIAQSMYRIKRYDGKIRWVLDVARSILVPESDCPLIQGSIYDITPRKLAEEALIESQNLATTLLNASDESTILLKPDGTVVAINEIGAQRLDITPEDIGKNIFDLLPEEERTLRWAEVEQLMVTKAPYTFESEWKGLYYQTTVVPILDNEGEIQLGAVFSRDITQHKLSEDALREKNRQITEQQLFLEGIYNGVDTPMFVVGVEDDGTFKYVDNNDCHLRALGIPKEAFVGKTPDELVPPFPQECIARVKERYRTCVETKKPMQYEEQLFIQGHEIWSLTRLTPLLDSTGHVYRIIGFSIDITSEKQTEQAYRESEDRYRRLLNASPISIVAVQNGTFVYCNPAAIELLGYADQEELIGQNVLEVVVPTYHDTVRTRLSEIEQTTTSKPLEIEIERRDGSIRIIETRSVAMQLNNSQAVLVLSNDITERRKLEEQLIQSQKMESVGRLAGGIAHDFNNLLTVITGNSELALSSLSKGSELYDELTEISATADRAARLTRQLLAFSRKQIIEPRIISINDVLLNLDRMLRRLIGEDIELVVLPAATLWPVKVDPGQLEQVLINLVVNAREAMTIGGTITIRTMNLKRNKIKHSLSIAEEHEKFVAFSVSDTGVGMDRATQTKIFEPFFTTKTKAKGTGLGLSTCYGIIKQSHGEIVVDSEPGKGSTFTVYLPVTGETQTLQHRRDEQPLPTGTETVMVVEDEDSVRRMVVRMLADKGYRVMEASNGEEALKSISQFDGTIDLVVTDVVMPRMGGRELADILHKKHPEIKILFMSGYTDERIDQDGVLEGGVAFLQKPFTPKVMLTKMREILGT